MSYEEQLKESQPQLSAFVQSKIYNSADACDIIQDVNRVAINKEESFDSNKCFESWIIGIAKYQIKDFLKRKKKLPDISSLDVVTSKNKLLRQTDGIWLDSIPYAGIVVQERRILQRQIREALTKKQKKVFDLLCASKSVGEIALELDERVGYINTLRYRIIQRAKKTIQTLNALNGYDYRSNR